MVARSFPTLALLIGIGCTCVPRACAQGIDLPVDTLKDKIRGGLLGQMIGDLNGLKHEMKYINEPGNVEAYTPSLPEGAWTDDDTDIEWVYVAEIQKSKQLYLPPERIVEAWKKHINRSIWCSNQYVRQLMDLGMAPPLTGHIQFNPWADFNLSGQFLSETWGLIAPGMAGTATRLGLHYTTVGIDLEPAQSTQFFTTVIAGAFVIKDIDLLLDAGLAAVDRRSDVRKAIVDASAWYKAHPSDWREARRLIQQKYSLYGGNDERDRNGVKLNAAATVAALHYGKGDFAETLRYAFNFGWDADNNAAMAGTVIGVIKGNKWMMSQGWKIQDQFRNTTRDDMPANETITTFGDRLIELAERAIKLGGGYKATVGGQEVYRIPPQKIMNRRPLENPAEQLEGLQHKLELEIERSVTSGKTSQERARAAYMAICLDLAPDLRKKHPQEWQKSAEALNEYPKVLQVLFYQSPIPAGEELRKKALAAGVVQPPKQEKLW